MDADETVKGVRMLKEALEVLSRGPFDYTLKCLLAARETLLTRYAPFKVGDRVILALTPTINEKTAYGWLGSKHFLKVGAPGVVRSSDVRSNGELRFEVEFDDESWLDRDGVAQPVSKKHTYGFAERYLAHSVKPNV